MLKTPALLALFAAAPVGGAVYRAIWFQTPPEALTAFEAAILSRPTALWVHIVAACALSLLGALQVAPALRRAHPTLHKRLGYVAWTSGVIMGASGIWIVLAFPTTEGSEPATQAVRLIFGALTLWWCADGLCAAIQRDIPRHRAQMLRLFVFSASATTNALLIGAYSATGAELTPRAFTILLTAGWTLALIAAEALIHRRPTLRNARI
ncbi:DUF2306 domain-containing protein [Tropicibacter naphthalenivorans]|uniref:DUF2306 domain-containing protein n=1 Tax=Tropicibacter naphthalenivorans TaxID=441103 RepID=A0A0P1G0I1_9RHOB|nr:DUF2306 domain-containing protein [Tropicibacter naphthalenivorans]CUH75240.1 hypothetical protein TRN7648_00338 [Tropicibacter naphthalenivorans]SMC45418.1 Predicted membrane protein [Tropicibacter naphthalenivorans]